jgi:cytochrome c oxidase subunit IV
MSEPSQTHAIRISVFVLAVIFITLALSLAALYLSIDAYWNQNEIAAGYFLVIGFIGLLLSSYMLLQTRRKVARIASLEAPQIMTTITCLKCNVKNVREFQRGDFVFKEVGQCPQCNEKMIISAIYREIKEKEKEERF